MNLIIYRGKDGVLFAQPETEAGWFAMFRYFDEVCGYYRFLYEECSEDLRKQFPNSAIKGDLSRVLFHKAKGGCYKSLKDFFLTRSDCYREAFEIAKFCEEI